jgi:hypothetical protein
MALCPIHTKHKAEDLLIELRCSYPTRKKLHNIAKSIVVGLKNRLIQPLVVNSHRCDGTHFFLFSVRKCEKVAPVQFPSKLTDIFS